MKMRFGRRRSGSGERERESGGGARRKVRSQAERAGMLLRSRSRCGYINGFAKTEQSSGFFFSIKRFITSPPLVIWLHSLRSSSQRGGTSLTRPQKHGDEQIRAPKQTHEFPIMAATPPCSTRLPL